MLGLYLVAPASAQLVEVPVGVTLLDGFIELLQQLYMSALGSGKIVAVSPIKAIQLAFIGLVDCFGTGKVESSGILLTQAEQINRR
ncbi:hypothetical protein D9M68_737660 [compost metagenome]